MAQTLGSLYQVARELLQRGQYGISGKCCYIKKNTIWKLCWEKCI